MFYILVSRVPFVYNIGNKGEKLFRTFLIGSVCYIILHGLLYSKRFSNNQFVEKYKKYLLYLVGADLSLASSIIYFLDKKVEDQENSYIEDVSDNDDNNTIEENNDKMTREQILQNFYRNQMIAQQQQAMMAQQAGSPFINKSGAEELKKKSSDNTVDNKEQKESKEAKETKETKEVKSVSSEKKNNTEELELSNADDMQSKLSDKNKSLEKLLEVISDTDIPLYQPMEVQQKN
jgi:hypothetical protein